MLIRNYILVIYLSVIFWAINGTYLAAQEVPPPLVTDRPDQTELPITVPAKSFQIEMGFFYTNTKETDSNVETETESFELGSTLFRYWLLPYLELRLSSGYFTQKSKNVIGESDAEGLGGIIEHIQQLLSNLSLH